MAYTSIDKPTDYFNTVLYTGDGNDGRTVTGVGFQPDWVWLKGRSEAEHHTLNDSVRGANKQVYSHLSYSEATDTDRLQSFDSDGFTLGTDVIVNKNTETFVSWNWLAGGSASSNSDGSITSSVSANTTAGFSIVSYTGTGSNATVGHGLGVVPNLIFIKRRDGAGDWTSYHSVLGSTKFMRLNSTIPAGTQSTYFQDTDPTSTVFSIGSAGDVNTSSGTHIAYCFADKKGYSKFGSYTGNGNADGTFVYTGFKPAFILVKDSTGSGNNWFIWDNKRDGYNVVNRYLRPNLSNAEGYYEAIDILSNGFKNRNTSGSANGSQTYIYMALAESPFVSSGGIPTTAR